MLLQHLVVEHLLDCVCNYYDLNMQLPVVQLRYIMHIY